MLKTYANIIFIRHKAYKVERNLNFPNPSKKIQEPLKRTKFSVELMNILRRKQTSHSESDANTHREHVPEKFRWR